MSSIRSVRSVILLAALGLAFPLPLCGADAEDVSPPRSLEQLFQDYVKEREDARRLGEERDANQNRLSDLEQQIRQIQMKYATEVRPVRSELSQARAKLAICNRVLAEREPPKPVVGRDVNAGNRIVQQRYNRDLEAFRQRQNQAQKEKPDLEQRIAQLETQLASLDARLESEQKPLLVELRECREKQEDLARQVGAATSRARPLADALRRTPEEERLRRGIYEWEDTFCSLDELRRIHDDLKTECDRNRAELKAKAETDGRPFPEDWRHPRQDKIDALKTLIERAEKKAAAAR